MSRYQSIEARFWSGVNKQPDDGCWLFSSCNDRYGYGRLQNCGRMIKAHRFSYELLVGPIPTGLTIDHLCRNPGCVRPDHLEAVSHRENVLRGVGIAAKNAVKTHCPSGHHYSASNTYISKGKRSCKRCNRRRCRERRAHIARAALAKVEGK